MADILGKLKTCTLCENQEFFKFIETVTTDGGFGDRYAKFEDSKGKGWGYILEIGGDICPECLKSWKIMVRNFVGEEKAKRIAPIWRLEEE